MSERTAPALEKLDALLPKVKALPAGPGTTRLVEEAEALRRAVAAFHMEAIRFRMYNVDRQIAQQNNAECLQLFDAVRKALEEAGFHTRSHAAP